ncbi:MAG: response regulator transcription factor [Ruminococcus sp.]|nr:response regulator transcription factor [Ruminococcus sp.]
MIYLLEDDEGIRNFVLYALNSAGFEAEGFELPSVFRKALSRQLPELVLLDIMLPEEDGLSVLRSLRHSPETAELPVIMLTAKGTEYDKVTGLDAGADDYIAKPFGTMELISRIRALLRRSGRSGDTGLSIGGITIYPQRHEVDVNGESITLTKKEYDLLLILVRNRGTVFSRDELLSKVWGYDFTGESRTVDVHIRTLRAKLGKSGDVIETLRGVGYKAGEPSND